MRKVLFQVGLLFASLCGFLLLGLFWYVTFENKNFEISDKTIANILVISIFFLVGVYLLNTNKPEKD